MTGPGLFPPPPPRAPTREELQRRLEALLRGYHGAGGADRDDLDRKIRELRAQIDGLPPRPAPPAAPPPARPRAKSRTVHDGRLAATGELKEN